MTCYEYWMIEYHKLPNVIKQREDKIARLQKRLAETADERLKKSCVNDIKSEMTAIEQNRKRLEELEEALHVNVSLAHEDVVRETSGPTLLCDKVWNRRSNR